MGEPITEKKYPVQWLWVLRSFLNYIGIIILVFILASPRMKHHDNFDFWFYGGLFSIALIYYFLKTVLHKITFHYSIDDKLLVLRQGILSKQERFIPYGVIQNVLVDQGLLDRVFGLATLTIENASLGGGSLVQTKTTVFRKQPKEDDTEQIGSRRNTVRIPGLTKQNAETLKEIILNKIKENPIDDRQSGL